MTDKPEGAIVAGRFLLVECDSIHTVEFPTHWHIFDEEYQEVCLCWTLEIARTVAVGLTLYDVLDPFEIISLMNHQPGLRSWKVVSKHAKHNGH